MPARLVMNPNNPTTPESEAWEELPGIVPLNQALQALTE